MATGSLGGTHRARLATALLDGHTRFHLGEASAVAGDTTRAR